MTALMIAITTATIALSVGFCFRIILDLFPSPNPPPITHTELCRIEARNKGYVLNRPAYSCGREIYVPKDEEWLSIYNVWTGEQDCYKFNRKGHVNV